MLNLIDLEKPLPRYTSYPTAPNWTALDEEVYKTHLQRAAEPLSLYFHLPFCHSMCLFCGCSVVLNRKEENEIQYVDFLCKEIQLVAKHLGGRKKVAHIHFGGGTPTKLSQHLLEKIFHEITTHFDVEKGAEIAIEIDPRTVASDHGEKLKFLRALGFNRVSFGVQDVDPQVQEAIKRRQSMEVSKATFFLAKELQFSEVNIDLIYGLPLQTRSSFAQTTAVVASWKSDSIALFSYAKVPWLKKHQKAIPDHLLPSTQEKFHIYSDARSYFCQNSYTAIGMDHFALDTSRLAKSYQKKTLKRNFQGYTVEEAPTLLGFGITAIGFDANAYFQNCKELGDYYGALQKNRLPLARGKVLSEDDLIRKWVIEKIMCTFKVDKNEFKCRFGQDFDAYFSSVDDVDLKRKNLLLNTPQALFVTASGELFVRHVASLFDAYLAPTSQNPKFSSAI